MEAPTSELGAVGQVGTPGPRRISLLRFHADLRAVRRCLEWLLADRACRPVPRCSGQAI